jgi:hypothetical protein
MFGKLVIKNFGEKDKLIDLSERTKTVDIFVSCVKTPQRVTVAGEDFFNLFKLVREEILLCCPD